MSERASSYHWRFLAGACTGVLVKTLVAPVERLKLLFETQTMFQPLHAIHVATIPQLAARIYREDGVRGFYRGNLINILRTGPNSAIKFMTYDLYSQFFSSLAGPEHAFVVALGAGALSGATQVAITYPLDVVRSRIMLGRGYDGILDCLGRTYADEGFRALYRGLGTTLCGVMPYVAVSFAVYDWAKRLNNTGAPSFATQLCSAAAASLIAGSLTVPIDVVRRRLQLQGSVYRKETVYKSALHAFATIYRSEGLRGLYRGLSFQVLRSVPATSLQLVLYDRLKRWLQLED